MKSPVLFLFLFAFALLMMKEDLNKTVTDLLRIRKELFKKSVKKEIKEAPEMTPEQIIKRVEERKKEEHKAIESFQKKVETFYTNLSSLQIPLCENLESRCLTLDILLPKDILELHDRSTKGMCDFFSKCRHRRPECGKKLKPWTLSLSLPDTKVIHTYKNNKKEDGEE